MTLDALPGEHVRVLERMIVAPAVGIFRLRLHTIDGHLDEGDVVGELVGPGTSELVLSPFRGQLMGMIASDGQRLRAGQPVAWLRVA